MEKFQIKINYEINGENNIILTENFQFSNNLIKVFKSLDFCEIYNDCINEGIKLILIKLKSESKKYIFY